jgi:hypothetical protein
MGYLIRKYIYCFSLSLLALGVASLSAEAKASKTSISDEQRQAIISAMEEIRKANIARHVPSKSDFSRLLTRDVNHYFRKQFRGSWTSSELLKEEPIQAGVGFPHFYLWVKVQRKRDGVITQGAIRLSAIDKKYFLVEDFITDKQIRANPALPNTIFPDSLCSTIVKKAFTNVI